MNPVQSAFATPAAWMQGAHLARVVDVADPEQLGRVKVALYATDPENEAALWARVAVGFAGDNYGAFLIPDVGEEVLVVFAAGAANAPIVVGSLWNGNTKVPESLPGSSVDRWTFGGKAGTRIAIIEDGPGNERVEIETPGGAKALLTDAGGGKIEFRVGGSSIRMDPGGISIRTGGTVTINGAQLNTSFSVATHDAMLTQIKNVTLVDTIVANSVISASYSPGAGNVW